ncbi:hypothetical protein N9971_00025 [bacterium]|nr:hypothetical protein [bacterium]
MRKFLSLLVCAMIALTVVAVDSADRSLDPFELPGPCPDPTDPAKCGSSDPPDPHFAVLHGVLRDNGDDDGWADSRETVSMQLTIFNGMRVELTGIAATLTSDDPDVACILDPVIEIADLGVSEQRVTEDAFRFTMAEIERVDHAQELTAKFTVTLTVDQFAEPFDHTLVLDLNLDVMGGAGPTTFFEGFEGGFGQFVAQHLDANLNPPDDDLTNDVAGVANSDGFRCQYSDPDWDQSVSYGSSQAEVCYPNPTGAPDAFWFHVIEDRAYRGAASMYFGTYLPDVDRYTTPTAQLEAIATAEPVHLAYDMACDGDPTIACASDLECPVGQNCIRASPVLSFKHQVSFIDHRAH